MPHLAAIARLQLIAEKVLPESQCDFRNWRGCVDMSDSCLKRVESMMNLYLFYLLTFARHMTWYLERPGGRY